MGSMCRVLGIEVGVGIIIVTYSRILANVLRYACCVADGGCELVAEDARRLGGLAVVACAAGELELL